MTDEELNKVEKLINSGMVYHRDALIKMLEEIKLLRAAFTDSMLDTDGVAEAKRTAFRLGQEKMRR